MFVAPGMTGIEFSITFDTNYATTGGEASLGLETVTTFPTKVKGWFVTKPPRLTNYVLQAELVRGTSDNPTNCKIQLFRPYLTSSTNNLIKYVECSTTNDLSTCKMRAIIYGY
jgi:hypothetical protein